MKKTDWLDYFKAVNGRAPSEQEIMQAYSNGEFQEEKSVGTDNYETSTNEHVTVSNSTTEQPSIDQVSQSQTQQDKVQETKVIAKNFWAWFLLALKSPTSEIPTNKFNGYITWGILSLFYTITLFTYIRNAISFSSLIISNTFIVSNYHLEESIGFQPFISILFVSTLFIFSIVFAGFITKKMVFQEETFTFSKSLEWYGRLFASNILVTALAALTAILSLYRFSLSLICISIILFVVANTFTLAHSKSKFNIDIFYKYLIAIFINGSILAVFGWLGITILSKYFINF